jgi:hypothetical protein
MAITRKLIQERPNTSVEFYVAPDEIKNIINSKSGNFSSITSEDGLTNTISFTLSDEDYELMRPENNATSKSHQDARIQHCEGRSIVCYEEEI